jgi:hypothetical protein
VQLGGSRRGRAPRTFAKAPTRRLNQRASPPGTGDPGGRPNAARDAVVAGARTPLAAPVSRRGVYRFRNRGYTMRGTHMSRTLRVPEEPAVAGGARRLTTARRGMPPASRARSRFAAGSTLPPLGEQRALAAPSDGRSLFRTGTGRSGAGAAADEGPAIEARARSRWRAVPKTTNAGILLHKLYGKHGSGETAGTGCPGTGSAAPRGEGAARVPRARRTAKAKPGGGDATRLVSVQRILTPPLPARVSGARLIERVSTRRYRAPASVVSKFPRDAPPFIVPVGLRL